VEIRELSEADAASYWPLRLRALREEPESFGSSYEEAKDRPLEHAAARLREMATQDDFILGAFADDQLVGIVAFSRESGRKNRHIGGVYQMYVAQEARGAGVGRALMRELLAQARAIEALELLTLAVVTSNTAARALYASLGFATYGTQPRALKLDDGRYLDEDLMLLSL
jgi:ribosomal protein S18 acetylase RimI-like enzyme